MATSATSWPNARDRPAMPSWLLGNRSQSDIARLAAAADVIAVPSVHDDAGNVDGLPNFALEALATATPVVATRVGGLPQAIDDGANGRLVAERDAGALAAAIARPAAASRTRRGGSARRRARVSSASSAGRASRNASRRPTIARAAAESRFLVGSVTGVLALWGHSMTAGAEPRPVGLTVFFPAYNDSGTIASLVISARKAAAQLTSDFEIIIVNDGSADRTAEIADELARTYPEVRVVHHPKNRGYGGALRSGFANATKELVFYTDGDAQYDPEELRVLWPQMTDAVDLVNGYKISRSDPLHRIVIGRVYHYTVKTLFGLSVRDVDCDFRLIRRRVFDRVSLEHNSGVICLEMMKKIQDAGFRIAEVPVHHYHRVFGKSQFFNVRRLVRTAIGRRQAVGAAGAVSRQPPHASRRRRNRRPVPRLR